ncbi:MAG: PrsW family glutamic-type intramembrane protease [Vulcanimicrobiota bacterium]
MLSQLQTFLLSLLPGIFWITYLRSLSAGRSPAWWKWAIALVAGWASTELTLWLSGVLKVDALQGVPYLGLLIYFVVGVGLVEEAAKALCALVALKWPGLLPQPLTALQLSGGVALGFATVENMLYAQNYGDTVLVFRFVLATLGHLLFSALWGFALGRGSSPKMFFGMLLLSAGAHGLYDWFLVTGRPVLAVLVLVVLWAGFREAVVGAYLKQEYQRALPFELEACSSCRVLTRADGNYCSFCGSPLKPRSPCE